MVRRFDAAVAQRLHSYNAETEAYVSTGTKKCLSLKTYTGLLIQLHHYTYYTPVYKDT